MSAEYTIGMVVVALGTIIGLFLSVGKPIIELNTSITKLTITVNTLQKDMDELKKTSHDEVAQLARKNSDAHEKFFDRLDDHEERLIKLEK